MHASARSLVQAQRAPPAPGGAVHMVCVEYVRPTSVKHIVQRAALRHVR